MPRRADLALGLAICVWCCCQLGCSSLATRRPADLVVAETLDCRSLLDAAEQKLRAGSASEAARDERCIDEYFAACRLAWLALSDNADRSSWAAACGVYNSGLARLVPAAVEFGRLDPRRALMIRD